MTAMKTLTRMMLPGWQARGGGLLLLLLLLKSSFLVAAVGNWRAAVTMKMRMRRRRRERRRMTRMRMGRAVTRRRTRMTTVAEEGEGGVQWAQGGMRVASIRGRRRTQRLPPLPSQPPLQMPFALLPMMSSSASVP
jgi:hypothetical protein